MQIKSLYIIIALIFALQTQANSKTKLSWLFIYHMPYDNDLSNHGETILNSLKAGTNKDIAVVVQADFANKLGLKRYAIHNKVAKEYTIATETMSLFVYNDFYDWISQNFEFEHYAIVFLNHGGKLIEFGLDTYPEERYSDIHDLTQSIEKFNQKQNKKVDLLFLQQCARGSVESIFEFKNLAEYTLFSQTVLGAPNCYYEKTLKTVALRSDITGKELAETILKNECFNMYNSFSLIKNKRIGELHGALKGFFKMFTDSILVDSDKLVIYHYGGETYWDLLSLLNSVVSDDLLILAKAKLIAGYLDNDILYHYRNPNVKFIQKHCGLSIYSPFNTSMTNPKYKRLKVFQQIDYGLLKQKIVLQKSIPHNDSDVIFR